MEHFLRLAVEEATKQGADYAEARYKNVKAYVYAYRNGKLEPPSLRYDRGMSIRVTLNGCLGFASTNALEKHSVLKLAKTAVKMGRTADKLGWKIVFSKCPSINAKWEVPVVKPFSNIPVDDKIDMLKEVDKALFEKEICNLLTSRFLSYHEETDLSEFLNSEEANIESTVSRVSFSAFLTVFKAGFGSAQRVVYKGGTGGWEVVEKWKLRETLRHEGEILGKSVVEGRKPPSDIIDLILGPEVVGIICHESCGHPQEADRILGREAAQAGKSYLRKGMLGHRIGSEHVTIVDDPTLKASFGHYKFDDEGVKAGERTLIEKGVVKGLLHNRETAYEFGVESNGSARASGYDKEPIVRMANTYMKPGDFTSEELIEDVKHGVFIKNFMEWNIDDLRFNQRYVGLESYLIEKGEKKNLIKNPILEITTPGLYKSVDAASNKAEFDAAVCGKGDPMQPIPVWHGGPEIRLRNIRLGG